MAPASRRLGARARMRAARHGRPHRSGGARVGRGVSGTLTSSGIRVTDASARSLTGSHEPLPEIEQAKAARQAPRRVGVLGGTFDPPHIGHLWLATLAADELSLDRVLFVPAAQPPHKRRRPVTAAAHRLLMTRLAIATDPLF